LEANTNDLHAKFESALAHLEEESDQKDLELESLQETIDKLGEQIYQLEDENDRFKEEHERMREEEIAERDRLEALSAALKEVRLRLSSSFIFCDLTPVYRKSPT
jgi:septation ring formation regulator EzrA